MIVVVLAAFFFGCIAFIATQSSTSICSGIVPAEDGPRPSKPPYPFLVGGAAAIGGILAWQGTQPLQLGIAAVVIFALVASWTSDALCGFLPDVFTLGPLGVLVLFALAQRDWGLIVSALIVFVPFAAAAFFSRGLGMGWGDAKLVAITGAVLGAPLGAMALAVACAVAVVAHRFSSARSQPIAFAPYIAALTAVALPLGLTH
ncbi:MAG TPA: prepilin peptidase [Candidatus Cybelea sp.]|jgi:prepilin signal peptidase PulO-like enzyme (type II secretory pathway)|nr:prepilin peptidase [Candidatus Cybelea sp.]